MSNLEKEMRYETIQNTYNFNQKTDHLNRTQ